MGFKIHTGSTVADAPDWEQAAEAERENRARRTDPATHEKNRARCGKEIVAVRSTRTGNLLIAVYRCEQKQCDFCGGKIAEQYRNRIEGVVANDGNGSVMMTIVPTESIDRKFGEKLGGRSNYMKLAQEDGTTVVFYRSSACAEDMNVAGTPVSSDVLDTLNWKGLVNGPTIVSGTLGKTTTPKTEESVMVTVAEYSVAAKEHGKLREIDTRVMLETIEYNPKDIDELKSCLSRRDSLTEKYLKEMEIQFTKKVIKTPTILSAVNWLFSGIVSEGFAQAVKNGKISQARVDFLLLRLDASGGEMARQILTRNLQKVQYRLN